MMCLTIEGPTTHGVSVYRLATLTMSKHGTTNHGVFGYGLSNYGVSDNGLTGHRVFKYSVGLGLYSGDQVRFESSDDFESS